MIFIIKSFNFTRNNYENTNIYSWPSPCDSSCLGTNTYRGLVAEPIG